MQVFHYKCVFLLRDSQSIGFSINYVYHLFSTRATQQRFKWKFEFLRMRSPRQTITITTNVYIVCDDMLIDIASSSIDCSLSFELVFSVFSIIFVFRFSLVDVKQQQQ